MAGVSHKRHRQRGRQLSSLLLRLPLSPLLPWVFVRVFWLMLLFCVVAVAAAAAVRNGEPGFRSEVQRGPSSRTGAMQASVGARGGDEDAEDAGDAGTEGCKLHVALEAVMTP
jgi:hypothetical protein